MAGTILGALPMRSALDMKIVVVFSPALQVIQLSLGEVKMFRGSK